MCGHYQSCLFHRWGTVTHRLTNHLSLWFIWGNSIYTPISSASYRQIHLEVKSGLRGTGAILIFKMNLTIGDGDTMSDGGDNSSFCDKLACFSLVISLGMYVYQQSCYSQWIYSKNLSLRFLEETEVYSSPEPLATAFSWTGQHTALFYMLLSNTQQIHDHSLRPGTLQVMPGRRSSNTHLPLCPFSASSHSGTSLNTFPTVLGVIFFF